MQLFYTVLSSTVYSKSIYLSELFNFLKKIKPLLWVMPLDVVHNIGHTNAHFLLQDQGVIVLLLHQIWHSTKTT